MTDDELSKQADQVYRQADFMAKTANAGAPHQLVAAQADILARAAFKLWQMCDELPEDEIRQVRVNTIIPDAFQAMHSELFGNHIEGTLPDTIPEEWKED